MKTYRQFIAEGADHFADYVEWGFVDPKGKIIDSIDYADDEEVDIHDQLARKLRIANAKEAVKKGYIRWHLSAARSAEFLMLNNPDIFPFVQRVAKKYDMDSAKKFIVDLVDKTGKRVYTAQEMTLSAVMKDILEFANRKIKKAA